MTLEMISALQTLDELSSQSLAFELTGSQGDNRAPATYCQLTVTDDLSAVRVWLMEFNDQPNTARIYRKEVERLLLWCWYQHKKALSSLKREDFEAYVDFLADPQPREVWCGTKGGRGRHRGSASWRPFEKGLNENSMSNALIIISSLFEYLKDAGYVMRNPLKLMKRLNSTVAFEERQLEIQQRILEPDEWHAYLDALDALPVETPRQIFEKARVHFMVNALFYLGLRVSDVATHRWNAFRKINEAWWFVVKGKGGKWGKIPVAEQFWGVVLQYRVALGLCPVPAADDLSPLLPRWSFEETGIQARQINNWLKKVGKIAAEQFSNQPTKAKKILKLSAHWIRHQSATQQDLADIPEEHIQHNLRHSKRDTTRLYVHTYDKARHASMRNFKIR